jgi:hypothetical protein
MKSWGRSIFVENNMSDRYMRLVAHINYAMAHDAYDQSEKLAETYLSADIFGRELLDRAFTCLCGCRLKTIMENADLDDPTAPESHWSEEAGQ